jgi:hypothetical protein
MNNNSIFNAKNNIDILKKYKQELLGYLKLDQTTPQETTGKFKFDELSVGDDTNNTTFEADGTMQAIGDATCFRDELNDLIKSASQNPSSHLVYDYTEGTLDFKDSCDLNDWALMNIQINHDWKLGSAIEPHIHWFQNAAEMPNWMIQYRWQKQCSAKTTDWTSLAWTENACEYVIGTINQVTSFGLIEAPEGYGEVSDIVQFRLLRDNDNDSGLFDEIGGGVDGINNYTGDAEAVSYDAHICVDMLGSRQLYVK